MLWRCGVPFRFHFVTTHQLTAVLGMFADPIKQHMSFWDKNLGAPVDKGGALSADHSLDKNAHKGGRVLDPSKVGRGMLPFSTCTNICRIIVQARLVKKLLVWIVIWCATELIHVFGALIQGEKLWRLHPKGSKVSDWSGRAEDPMSKYHTTNISRIASGRGHTPRCNRDLQYILFSHTNHHSLWSPIMSSLKPACLKINRWSWTGSAFLDLGILLTCVLYVFAKRAYNATLKLELTSRQHSQNAVRQTAGWSTMQKNLKAVMTDEHGRFASRRNFGHSMPWTEQDLAVQNLANVSLILKGLKERISALGFSDIERAELDEIDSSLFSINQTRSNIAELNLEALVMPDGRKNRSSHQPLYSGNPADYALSRWSCLPAFI